MSNPPNPRLQQIAAAARSAAERQAEDAAERKRREHDQEARAEAMKAWWLNEGAAELRAYITQVNHDLAPVSVGLGLAKQAHGHAFAAVHITVQPGNGHPTWGDAELKIYDDGSVELTGSGGSPPPRKVVIGNAAPAGELILDYVELVTPKFNAR